MSYTNKTPEVTEVYVQLKAVSMSDAEREEALHALHFGESLASGLLWIANGAKHLFTSLRQKPGFKREVAI